MGLEIILYIVIAIVCVVAVLLHWAIDGESTESVIKWIVEQLSVGSGYRNIPGLEQTLA